MQKAKGIGIGLGVIVLLGLVLCGIRSLAPGGDSLAEGAASDDQARVRRGISVIEPSAANGIVSESGVEAEEEPQTEEEKAAAAEEAAVDAFDALTDSWMEPATAKVDLKAIATFSETFRRVPEARRDECIHRALNLVPDENVMLLAGVLMDKSMPKEIVETVFNDVLNRDEDVKKPILQEIFNDKTHPCWADAAWILDVTGALKTTADGT